MKLNDALTYNSTKIKRPSTSEIEIKSGMFYENGHEYNLTVEDVLASDWEVRIDRWESTHTVVLMGSQ